MDFTSSPIAFGTMTGKMIEAMQWEYRTLEIKANGFTGLIDSHRIEEALVVKGLAGWELVSSISGGYGQAILLVFKRPIGPLRESHKDTDS